MGSAIGGCQCGALRYRIRADPLAVTACHCSDCQTQSGSAFSMSMVVGENDFEWTAGTPRIYHTNADSGATKECLFCAECGVRILNRLGSMPGTLNVKPGTLDDTSGVAPTLHVWLVNKQPWLVIPEGTRSFDRNPD